MGLLLGEATGHRWIFLKRPMTRKMFSYDDVMMNSPGPAIPLGITQLKAPYAMANIQKPLKHMDNWWGQIEDIHT